MTKLDLLITQRSYLIVVYSEIPFNKNSYHIQTIQLIYLANKLTGFYMIQGFTESYFQIEILPRYFNTFSSTYLLFTCSFLLIWKMRRYDWPKDKEIHHVNWTSACISTFTIASKYYMALSKSAFAYSFLIDDVWYRSVQSTLSRPLDQS